ncbi:hypothetical protein M513_04630 [Trichuris suis]|uniref:Uncharacterized protein n=1 Tax=Trichuris suis TaxID=68888 RepID=A0A085MB87_9BILA|nr:hypothetical protein M513_04630 [Trichuris suis]
MAMADDYSPTDAKRDTEKEETTKTYLDLETSVRDILVSVEENQALIEGYEQRLRQCANELNRWNELQKQVNDSAKTSKDQLLAKKEFVLVFSLIKENILLFELEGSVSRQLDCLNGERKRRAENSRKTEGTTATEKLLLYWQSKYEASESMREYKEAFDMYQNMRKEVDKTEEVVANLRGSTASLDEILKEGSKLDKWKSACCKLSNVALKNKKLEQEIDILKADVRDDDGDSLYDPSSICTQEIPKLLGSLKNADASANMKNLHEKVHLSPVRSRAALRDGPEPVSGISSSHVIQRATTTPKEIAAERPIATVQLSTPYTPNGVTELNENVPYSPPLRKRTLAVSEESTRRFSTKAPSLPSETYNTLNNCQQNDSAKGSSEMLSMEPFTSFFSAGKVLTPESPYLKKAAAGFNRSNEVTRTAPLKTMTVSGSESPTDAFVPPRAPAPRKFNASAPTADRLNTPSMGDSQSPLNFVINLMQSPSSEGSSSPRCPQVKSVTFDKKFTEGDNLDNFARRFSHQARRQFAE